MALLGDQQLEINGGERYDKSEFVQVSKSPNLRSRCQYRWWSQDFIFDSEVAAGSGLSECGIDHVIYVVSISTHQVSVMSCAVVQDDSVESAFVNADLGGTIDVVQLPKEGAGLTSALLSQVARLCKTAGAKTKTSVCVVYDFDCTLSEKHMFKSICQTKSTWAKQWQKYCAMTDSVPNSPMNSPSPTKRARDNPMPAGRAHSIAASPPVYGDLAEKPRENMSYMG